MKEYRQTFCYKKEKAYQPCGKNAFVRNDVFYWRRREIRLGKCRIKKIQLSPVGVRYVLYQSEFLFWIYETISRFFAFSFLFPHAVQNFPAFFVNGKSILYKTVDLT